jgi:hypothetical protein
LFHQGNTDAGSVVLRPSCRRSFATTDEVKQLRREAQDLKEVVAEQALELRLLKKSMIGDGGDQP